MGGYYTPPPGTGGGGIGGFPKVVAVSNLVAQSDTNTFDLLPGSLPSGTYMLVDALSITTPDLAAVLSYQVSWNNSGGGVTSGGGITGTGDAGSICLAGLALEGSGVGVLENNLFPATLQVLTGTPIHIAITLSSSAIASATPTSGNIGLGYAMGDTVQIDGGGISLAVFTVDTVDGSGGVLTGHISTPGSGYSATTGNTTTAVTGIGTGLELDTVLETSSSLVYDYHAALVRNQ